MEKSGKKFKSVLYEGHFGSQKAILIKPETYMNLSGEAVQSAAAFYKIPPESILAIYDDIDLPFGVIRLRKKGSAGTHNGMKSIVGSVGHGDFPRLRVGIGPVVPGWDLSDFVLANFSGEEEKALPEILKKAASAAETFVRDGIELAMNRFNA
jgi:PTH1 family peptidyl-tRNA hydrolase